MDNSRNKIRSLQSAFSYVAKSRECRFHVEAIKNGQKHHFALEDTLDIHSACSINGQGCHIVDLYSVMKTSFIGRE